MLGICVGMQILFERGVEHGVETTGCDEWPGVVERIEAPVVPHMGWNTVEAPQDTKLFAGIEDERFYFVHSYGVRDWPLVTNDRTRPPLVTWAEHGGDRFVAAVENGPLQRHPVPPGEVRRRRRAAAAQLGPRARCAGRDERGGAVMSKERARRREAREREAAIVAAARGAEAEKRERRDARKRALTSRSPRRRSRPTGVLAARKRRVGSA